MSVEGEEIQVVSRPEATEEDVPEVVTTISEPMNQDPSSEAAAEPKADATDATAEDDDESSRKRRRSRRDDDDKDRRHRRRRRSRSRSPRRRSRSRSPRRRSRSRSPRRRRSRSPRRRSRSPRRRSRSPRRRSRSPRRRSRSPPRRSRGYGGYGGRGPRHSSGYRRRSPPRAPEKSDRQIEREKARREREDADRAKDPAQRAKDDQDRDARTVFCFNLPIKGTEDDIADFFEKNAGPVRDVRLIVDRFTRRSKGVGYVEMETLDGALKALQQSGRQILGQSIMVQVTQSERNKIAAAQAAAIAGPTKIYVGGLHPAITEDDIRLIVTPIGPIEEINLHKDEHGVSKGFCFVTYKKAEDASRARTELNGMDLAGQTLKVGVVNNPTPPPVATMAARTGPNSVPMGMGGFGSLDDEGGHINASGRAALMAKLTREEPSIPGLAPPPPPGQGPPVPVQHVNVQPNMAAAAAAEAAIAAGRGEGALVGQTPSVCVLLKNMFPAPGPERGADFNVDEIREDVVEETKQHGQVLHCAVDANSAGEVYLKLGAIEAAKNVVKALNHRWFAGKLISATFLTEDDYYMRFPGALVL